MKVARVAFKQDYGYSLKEYDYYVPERLEARLQDLTETGSEVFAVVDSPQDGYSLVVVRDVRDGTIKATKPLIDVVDDQDYLEHKAKQSRREEILHELERRSRELGDVDRFEKLALSDAKAQELVDELRTIS